MKISIKGFLIFVAVYLILHGIWRVYFIRMSHKAYSIFKEGNETYFDYCCREINTWQYRFIKFCKLGWVCNTKLYSIFSILLGIINVLIGIAIIIFIIFIKDTEFGLYLDLEL